MATATNTADEAVVGRSPLEAFLHHGVSPKLDLSQHLARFTAAGLDVQSLFSLRQWTRGEAADALTRLLAPGPTTPGLSPFQLIALEHFLRGDASEQPPIDTLADFLAHAMPGVDLTHHLGLFQQRGIRSLTDTKGLYTLEGWEDLLRTLFAAGASDEGSLTPFEMVVLEKGLLRLREHQA
ncbi:hypothetical protein C8F01DRAFT_1082557 [Mycena amicta]|nr:hypothetical protein C8F01DRAFT_1082557 [Mycena amicta]